jgi:hypothetical protein
MRDYVPVPLNATNCGLPPPLSVIATFAVLFPFALGVNVTTTLQLAPEPRLAPQVFVSAKSLALVPVIAIEEMETVLLPLLLTITLRAILVVPTG